MKICIAQTESIKGDVRKNIENHVRFVKRASRLKADIVLFPELSVTGYEPELAGELAMRAENILFDPFQELSDKGEIYIGIGMPTLAEDGTRISMIIFQPHKERIVYSKQILHADELPYFIPGSSQTFLTIKDKKIAFGICYETLQREHFLYAHNNGADIYIACVAKSKGGIDKAFTHFAGVAREFNTPILMSNSVGYCDNFMSVGKSAVWNDKGELLDRLDDRNEGIILYDTALETTDIFQLKIERGQVSDADTLFQIYRNGKAELERNGVYQWTDTYPTISIVENDLRKGVLYTLRNRDEIMGAINISEEQETVYASVAWEFNPSKVLVIHRLVIDPKHQKNGYGHLLMDFAENFAKENGYAAIRLDAYSQNAGVLEFYRKRDYIIRGDVRFPEREFVFHCMEKEIICDGDVVGTQ